MANLMCDYAHQAFTLDRFTNGKEYDITTKLQLLHLLGCRVKEHVPELPPSYEALEFAVGRVNRRRAGSPIAPSRTIMVRMGKQVLRGTIVVDLIVTCPGMIARKRDTRCLKGLNMFALEMSGSQCGNHFGTG